MLETQTDTVELGVDALPSGWDLVLCDVFGTLHEGGAPFPAAIRALRRFRREGAAIVLLSNSAQTGGCLAADLARRGIAADVYDAIVTSADVARDRLAMSGVARVHHIGRSSDRVVFEALPLGVVPIGEAQVVVCTGWPEPAAEADPGATLDRAADAGLLLLCTDPATSVFSAGRHLRFAGLVADAYRARGGRVLDTGKPGPAIYERAIGVAETLIGRRPSEDRVLAIGDSYELDILGALAQGHRGLLVGPTASDAPAFPPLYRMPRLS